MTRAATVFHSNTKLFQVRGFALPTILIASIVMLSVLLVAVSSTTSVRTGLLSQYYEQLAHSAGDAGVAYARACLNANNGVPQWSDSNPLRPNTDCTGTPLSGVTCPDGVSTYYTGSTPALCSVTMNNNIRSSFSIGSISVQDPSVLVVGGGGSGGGSTGGGGGAGGYVYSPAMPLTVGSYPIVIGAGGAVPGNQAVGRSGADSTFNGITALGGGGGGFSLGGLSGASGSDGGSGGGGQTYFGTFLSGSAKGQGNDGGAPSNAGTSGGGGAGGIGGSNATVNGGGAGGIGKTNSITGTSLYYAGGGGGGNGGAGGNGGGGNGADVGASGVANTGGGGGGGWSYASGNGGAGGSGVVVISYPTGTLVATGGSITVVGANTIHKFTGNGTFNVTSVNKSVGSIPNAGFTQLLRNSNGAVWRTFNQPASQPVVTPSLCSGAASSALGWNSAAVTTGGSASFPDMAAKGISVSGNAYLNPGPVYYRKDFSVSKNGTYNLNTVADDYSEVYVDGVLQYTTTYPTTSTAAISLSSGCHTVIAKVLNYSVIVSPGDLRLSITAVGSSIPLVVTDSSWRFSAGNSVHFSQYNYDDNSVAWNPVRQIQLWSATTPVWAAAPTPAWDTLSGDTSAYWISTTHSYTSTATYPAGTAMFRHKNSISVTAPTEVRVSYACDDNCVFWLDGQAIANDTSGWATAASTVVTLSEGTHQFGVTLSNNASGPGGFLFAAVTTSTGTVLTNSNATDWEATNSWYNNDITPTSYDTTFIPSPDIPIPRNTNIAPAFSGWTLAGGATYNSTTGQLTIPATGSAISPMIRVGSPRFLSLGGDFYATAASPYAPFVPSAGYHTSASYYMANQSTPIKNSAGYTANGCAQSFPVNIWNNNDTRCAYTGGSGIEYAKFSFVGANGGYASNGLIIRNPRVILSD